MIDIGLLRDTIKGKINWTNCPCCNGSGVENWNDAGEDVRAGPTSDPDRCSGECENCNALGFIHRSS